MKTKTFLPAFSCIFLVNFAFGKGDFSITSQNLVADSSNSMYSYYHINAGSMITVEGEIHYSDAWGFYIGPADSVHWFYNNNPAGTTFGAQTISFSMPGIYSAIGYYAGTGYLSQIDIMLTVQGTTGIEANSTPGILIVENKREHILVINNFNSEKGFSVSLYSLAGMLVSNAKVNGSSNRCSLSLDGIRKGIYLVDIVSAEKRFSKKIVLGE